MSDGPTRTSPMTSAELEKIMADLTRERGDRRVCVFVPGIGDLEIRGVTTNGQITTFAPVPDAAAVTAPRTSP